MDITVVIPAWNEEYNIENAIQAILRQEFLGSVEIIVVDNNSTDRTFEKALDTGVVTVIKQTVQGTNATRQAGFQKAYGDIIAYCDADCVPPKDWLSNIYVYLQNERRVAVSGPYSFGDSSKLGWFDRNYAKLFSYLTHHSFFGKKVAIMIGGNFAVKKEALEKIGGFPDITFWGDDTCLALELAHHCGPVWFTPNLVVKSSPRRFQGKGRFAKLTTPFVSFWTSIKYIWAFLKIWIPFDPKNLRPRAKVQIQKCA
jgi:glycosyltransferase involved in cell wall biosynthesis